VHIHGADADDLKAGLTKAQATGWAAERSISRSFAALSIKARRATVAQKGNMGWVLIVLGVLQLTGGFSLIAGNAYGRVIGIIGGSLGAIGALLSTGQSNPWWSLGIFFLCVYIVHGIFIYGDEERLPGT